MLRAHSSSLLRRLGNLGQRASPFSQCTWRRGFEGFLACRCGGSRILVLDLLGNENRRLNGPVAYGQLTLKRGMTEGFDLWRWFRDSVADPRLRANAEVVLLAADGATVRARFVLSRCVPIKLKAPALNAKDGQVAVEELQVAYETLSLKELDA